MKLYFDEGKMSVALVWDGPDAELYEAAHHLRMKLLDTPVHENESRRLLQEVIRKLERKLRGETT